MLADLVLGDPPDATADVLHLYRVGNWAPKDGWRSDEEVLTELLKLAAVDMKGVVEDISSASASRWPPAPSTRAGSRMRTVCSMSARMRDRCVARGQRSSALSWSSAWGGVRETALSDSSTRRRIPPQGWSPLLDRGEALPGVRPVSVASRFCSAGSIAAPWEPTPEIGSQTAPKTPPETTRGLIHQVDQAPDLVLRLSGWRDLNPRPLRPERSALPSCATPRSPPVSRRHGQL